jgi:SAM-dependent methyltransferase
MALNWPRGLRAMFADKAPALDIGPDLTSSAPRDAYLAAARTLGPQARVLEVGTKQAVSGAATHSHALFPQVPRTQYTMADVEGGNDVDVVADLHTLAADWTGTYDAFLANAVFEHLQRPWIAAKEVFRILAPGGWCFISTHQTFPLHGYPSDYFRFSKEALALLFDDAGFDVVHAGYEHRAKIVPPATIVPPSHVESWNAAWPSFLVVNLFAVKRAP